VQQKIENYNKLGYNKFPICMAKTSNSLTGNPSIKGAPTDFTLDINVLKFDAARDRGFCEISALPGCSAEKINEPMIKYDDTGKDKLNARAYGEAGVPLFL
jgi:formyltetrahydrofolate synthetase